MNKEKIKGYISLGLVLPIWVLILYFAFTQHHRIIWTFILAILALIQPVIMIGYGLVKLKITKY